MGLATDGDYITCGSENNGLYIYYKVGPKPKFSAFLKMLTPKKIPYITTPHPYITTPHTCLATFCIVFTLFSLFSLFYLLVVSSVLWILENLLLASVSIVNIF